MEKFLRYFERLELSPAEEITEKNNLFRIILILYVNLQIWLYIQRTGWKSEWVLAATLLTVVSLVLHMKKQSRILLALLFLSAAMRIYSSFPFTANHLFSELFILMLALLFPEGEDDRLFLSLVKLLALMIIFLSGIQKLLYGHYFHGTFLVYQIHGSRHFRDFFSLFLPTEEIRRIAELSPGKTDSDFLPRSPLITVVSLVTLAGEIIIPAGLFSGKASRIWFSLAVIFFLFIEAAAREFSFGLFMMLLLALFLSAAAFRRIAAGIIFVLLLLIPAALADWFYFN